jgi:hypothetical protein
MPHEILQLGPWELSIAVACMAHGLALEERIGRDASRASPLGVVPVYLAGGV